MLDQPTVLYIIVVINRQYSQTITKNVTAHDMLSIHTLPKHGVIDCPVYILASNTCTKTNSVLGISIFKEKGKVPHWRTVPERPLYQRPLRALTKKI